VSGKEQGKEEHGQMARTNSDEGRVTRARELWLKSVELRKDARELALDTGITLKEVKDEGYFREMGFNSFEAYVRALFDISKDTADRYIAIVENVMKALPEGVAARAVSGDNPLPVALLAQLRFDHFLTPAEVKKLESLGDEEFKEEILRLGYDRDRMGGRAASDLLRDKISKTTYRDQRRKIQVLREKLECAAGEKQELAEQVKALNARIEQIIAAMENPESAKVIKQMDALTVRLAELEKARAADEAEIATGKEVGTRALILSGEIQALLGKFEDSVRIDKKAQWVEVRAVLHSAQDAIEQTIGRMAEVIIARVDSGEITRFSVEDPEGESGAAAEGLSEPRRR